MTNTKHSLCTHFVIPQESKRSKNLPELLNL